MENMEAKSYDAVLEEMRAKLAMRRGYGSRVLKKVRPELPNVDLNQVYAVAWGRKVEPIIFAALLEEAIAHKSDPKQESVTKYLKAVA